MKSLKLNALAAIMVRILNIVFPLITGPYIARTLSKENIGYFDSANILVQLLVPLATLGVYNYGIRNISKVKNDKSHINQLFSELFYVSSIATFLMSSFYLIYINFFSNIDYTSLLYTYYILGFQLFCQFLSIEWLNEAFENYSFILYKTIIVRITMFSLTFIMIRNPDDLLAYAFVMTLAEVLNLLLSFIWIKRDVKLVKVPFSRLKKLFYILLPMLILANISILFSTLDRLFLSKAESSIYIADYVMAQNIVMIITGIITGAISVNIPRLSYYLGENNNIEYEKLLYKGAQVFLFFTVPLAMGIFILSDDIALIYGGEKFLSAGIVIAIFSLRSIMLALYNILGVHIIFIKGYEKYITIFVSIAGLLNLLLKIFLYKSSIFSAEYYIGTTFISESLVLIFYIIFIKRKKLANIKPIFHNLYKYLLISISFILISFLIDQLIVVDINLSLKYILNVSSKILLSSLTYFLSLYFIRDSIIKEILKIIKNKLKRS